VTPQDLIFAFDTLAEAPDGVKRLRELVLQLAVRGKLVQQFDTDGDAYGIVEAVRHEREGAIAAKQVPKPRKFERPVLDPPFELPDRWSNALLDDISLYIQRGKSPKYDDDSSIRVVSQKCVQWSGFDLSRARGIREDSLPKYGPERFLRLGDLLWNSTGTGTVGRVNLFPGARPKETIVADSHVTVVRVGQAVVPGFVYLWLASPAIQGVIDQMTSGTTKQQELNTSTVRSQWVPIPPLAEQHRIVARVDELMGLLDRLEAARTARDATRAASRDAALAALREAETPEEVEVAWNRFAERMDDLLCDPADINPLRQAVLHLAVRGKLVPQDAGDEQVEVLFQQLHEAGPRKLRRGVPDRVPLNEQVAGVALPPTWEVCSVAECLRIGLLDDLKDGNHGANHPKVAEFTKTGLPFITAAQVGRWTIDFDSAYRVSGEPLARLRVGFSKPGDVIYTHKGSVGRVAINTRDCVLTPQTTYYRPSTAGFDARYLQVVLSSPFFRRQVDFVKQQTTRDFVPISAQYRFFMPVPPRREQRRIADRVDLLTGVLDRLEARLIVAQSTHGSFASAVVHHLDA